MALRSKNPEVIVVGAGTAGLSAAGYLVDAGLEVIVLEAESHVGGRCITDNSVFDTPFDRGGSWLHSAEINPLAALAEDKGIQLHKERWSWERVFANERNLTKKEVSQYQRYHDEMWDRINATKVTGDDIAIEHVLPDSPWRETAKHWVAQMLGGDFDVTSARDSARYKDAEGDWLVSGGLGAFVRSLL